MNEDQRTIPVCLHGALGKKFGKRFDLAINSPAEATRMMIHLLPGFREYLYENRDKPFRVLVGNEARDEKGMQAPVGRMESIKFVPVVKGAKGATGQIILGAALIALSFYTAGGSSAFSDVLYSYIGSSTVGAIGWTMALGGVAQLLTNAPSSKGLGMDGTQDATTWAFGSPTMTTGQGGCVPYCGGLHRISGHVISSGIDAQTYQDKGFGGQAPDNAGTRGGNGDTLPWVWAIAE